MDNLWSDAATQGLDDLDLLVYRSNLLGRDPTVVNPGGGNTSIKRTGLDFLDREIAVLTVKATGSDLATVTEHGFVDVALPDLLALRDRDSMTDSEMVEYLSHCLLDPAAPRPSIETLLHAFLPAPHIDHTHPNLGLAIATVADGERVMRDIFGDEAAWVPYLRPGFAMARLAAGAVEAAPRARFAVLQKHGAITWAGDAKTCYLRTVEFLQRVEDYLKDRDATGGWRTHSSPRGGPAQGHSSASGNPPAASLLPRLRGLLSGRVLRLDASPTVQEFLASPRARELAGRGLACPDHVLYTGVSPLFLDVPHDASQELWMQMARAELVAYEERSREFFLEHHESGDEPVDPVPTVVLVPGAGMVTAGKDARAAGIAAACYRQAIDIMEGAEAAGGFAPLTGSEAYDIQYWPLERYKLTLRPPEKELAGRIAFVTGGAGAIGRAICERFAAEGSQVVVADIDGGRAAEVAASLGADRALAVHVDVTSEESIRAALEQTVLAYGGLDILVCNAGIAFSHPIEETTTAEWQRTMDVLATGYFLTSREGIAVMRRQRRVDGSPLGGSIIFVSSKAGLAAARNASAYASAKAASLHLARCLAEEVAGDGIRVNSLAPDAIIQGSGLWAGQWGAARSAAHGVPLDQLADFYKDRNMLKIGVTAEDVAQAALFFASDRSRATTGGILSVDGGLHDGYVR